MMHGVDVLFQAGFEDPATEVEKRLADKAKTADSVKEFLGRIQPYASPEFHASLSDALSQVWWGRTRISNNQADVSERIRVGMQNFARYDGRGWHSHHAILDSHGHRWRPRQTALSPWMPHLRGTRSLPPRSRWVESSVWADQEPSCQFKGLFEI